MLAAFIAENTLFDWEAARDNHPVQGYGLRLAMAPIAVMTAVVGGRVMPSITCEWLVTRRSPVLPAPPMRSGSEGPGR